MQYSVFLTILCLFGKQNIEIENIYYLKNTLLQCLFIMGFEVPWNILPCVQWLM